MRYNATVFVCTGRCWRCKILTLFQVSRWIIPETGSIIHPPPFCDCHILEKERGKTPLSEVGMNNDVSCRISFPFSPDFSRLLCCCSRHALVLLKSIYLITRPCAVTHEMNPWNQDGNEKSVLLMKKPGIHPPADGKVCKKRSLAFHAWREAISIHPFERVLVDCFSIDDEVLIKQWRALEGKNTQRFEENGFRQKREGIHPSIHNPLTQVTTSSNTSQGRVIR